MIDNEVNLMSNKLELTWYGKEKRNKCRAKDID